MELFSDHVERKKIIKTSFLTRKYSDDLVRCQGNSAQDKYLVTLSGKDNG